MPELDWTGMEIHLAIKRDVKMPERLIEGSLGCAKTTLGLDCEIDALIKHPGIPVLLFRWTEDAVTTKLRVAFEELCHIRGIEHSWDSKEKRYTLPNGSTAYAFGLKANSLVEEFNKIRGIGVSRIFGDQVEEVRPSVAAELRGRLRPNLAATLRNERYPMQLTFVANPSDYEFWLSKEFPESNSIKGRKMYSISIFDNKHLPQESIDSMLRQYAPDHPKYLTLVMGRRGPNVTGVPVYEGLYDKSLHWRPMAYDPRTPILESFEFGKHTPTWVCAQALRSGGLAIIGGMIGAGARGLPAAGATLSPSMVSDRGDLQDLHWANGRAATILARTLYATRHLAASRLFSAVARQRQLTGRALSYDREHRQLSPS
jgi:hypothetical protein